ncbi:flagella biosynthesis regulatory protein FliT [Cedecea neteri]|uniref:Flagellar protein FliT n=1 Tax=Cedecea neteri TaxID=158822 RepID=A0AAN0S7T0_9ENTR|nr:MULTISPECIES: flagella biosynthesis regulatory protein FliT [Enterobacteriaceae]NIG76647.1 flagella biosynthesis regulatory protein FliT [Klebsiella sp. Ap-873]AIR62810.1 flagellar biosynthesis protein FliT [Cedecea neteri]NIF31265.1 flagella biosynthesis regulatory protein FliT [Enterobacter sp. Cy-643]WNJ81327.1 flagella biosynthesis regulatory protein FliT [Cedecea neteri]SMG61515.1 flagellar protein FliT [Cedecea sp. NFIX57]
MNDFISSLNEWYALHALSQTMLDLAHSGQWDELIEQEVKYVQLVEAIANNPIAQSSQRSQEEAKALLDMILANENQIKGLLNSRLSELRDLIDQSGRQKSLNNTYGFLSGNVLTPSDLNQ